VFGHREHSVGQGGMAICQDLRDTALHRDGAGETAEASAAAAYV
jgi:hypothetical protein